MPTMRTCTFAIALSTACFSAVANAQGCSSEEPNNPYCMLPLFTDTEVNATFDSLALNSEVSDYAEVEWSGLNVKANSTEYNLLPQSGNNYAHSANGDALLSATTDYMYMISFYFGCSTVNATTSVSTPAACTVELEGTCLPIGFPGYVGGQLEQLKWTYAYKPRAVHGKANLTYASPYTSKTTFDHTSKTNHVVLCTNYTLTAKTPSGEQPALYLDSLNMAVYSASGY